VPSPSGFYFETEISTIGVAGELLMDAALIVLGRVDKVDSQIT
jgi:hypothetical protein